jgi:hypothetical protein
MAFNSLNYDERGREVGYSNVYPWTGGVFAESGVKITKKWAGLSKFVTTSAMFKRPFPLSLVIQSFILIRPDIELWILYLLIEQMYARVRVACTG